MSVQSEIDRITDEVATQEELLGLAFSALERKTAGEGGGVELPTLDNPGAAEHLLQDKELINEVGVKVVGTMSNNGEVSRTMDGVNTKSVSIPAGYTSGGTVSLDDTIDNAVSDALAAITEKGVTVPAGTKVDGLADLIAAIESGGGAANQTKPNVHIEIASVGIWNASREGTAVFTFGNSINRKALGKTYDVSDAQFVEFDIYIPSGKDVTAFDGQSQFELSSGGKEDISESTMSGDFLSEYDINYGGWTHICIPLARFAGDCDYSALNFVGWYFVGSSYSITGCKVANLTFTSYNLQSKIVTPSDERQEIFPDSGYSGLLSVIVEAATGGGNNITLPSGYDMEMGIYIPDADKASDVTIDLQKTFRWNDSGKESACYLLMVGVDIRKGTQAAGACLNARFGTGQRTHSMVAQTSSASTSSTVFINPKTTTTFNQITLTGTESYPLKNGHCYLWAVIGETA